MEEPGQATAQGTIATLRSTVTESLIFNIVLFIFIGFILGVLIANAVYFNRIRTSGCANNISSNEATIMFWLNVGLAVASAIIWFWSIYRLIIIFDTREYSEKAAVLSAAKRTKTSITGVPERFKAAGSAFSANPADVAQEANTVAAARAVGESTAAVG